ncbi:MAG: hypothetical protein JXQ82_07635 [Methanomicrobiaceae archaeon]|nr:hypothetical protein [Methanomicrobiaceae archaeon]
MKLVAVEGDVDIASDAHDPPAGGGPKPITPVTQQTFARINNLLIVTKGEEFPCHCTSGYAGQLSVCSTVLNINEIPICREKDVSEDGEHTFSGIVVSNQCFVNSE